MGAKWCAFGWRLSTVSEDDEQLEMWSLKVAQRTYEESDTGKLAADANPCVRSFGFDEYVLGIVR